MNELIATPRGWLESFGEMTKFGGRMVARAIPGARLVLFDGMGHDLPEELWDQITGELTANFAQG